VAQLAKIDTRTQRLQKIKDGMSSHGIKIPEHQVADSKGIDMGAFISPEVQYHIGSDTGNPLVLGPWIEKHENDPAIKVRAT
jgi:hypothetical protein